MSFRDSGLSPDPTASDYAFGPFLLQTARHRLLESGRAIPISPRALVVLAILVAERGRTVSKHELLSRAWGGRAIADNNLTVAMSALRRALRDTDKAPIVKTVPGYGYRFVADATAMQPDTGGVAEMPSIAVLPFVTEGSGEGHDLLGNGIADALVDALSRNRWLAVTAYQASAALGAGSAPDEAAQRLGVRYVLRGSVQPDGPRVRVAAQLTDVATGSDLVVRTLDSGDASLFAARDEMAAAIITAVRPALVAAEQQRSILKPPGNLDAWSACQRGAWHLARFGRPELQDARTWFQRATVLDPSFAPGFHGLALAYLFEGSSWLPHADPHWQPRGESLALQAVVLDDRDSGAHAVLGFARMVRGDHAGSLQALRVAVGLNPNDAMALGMLGATLVYAGHIAEGLDTLDACFRLSPSDPRLRIRRAHAVLGHFFARDHAVAEEAARAMIAEWPDDPIGPRLLCYVLAETGCLAGAREALALAVALAPAPFERFTHDRMPWYRINDFRRVVAALRLAGWAG